MLNRPEAMASVFLKVALLLLSSAMVAMVTAQCPACTCEESSIKPGAIIINCAFQGLTQVPTFTPDSFQYYELTLVGNSITSLPNNAFQGIIIEKLDLRMNQITSIQDNAFNGLQSKLKILLLETQRMSSFPTLAVNSLTILQTFSMSGFNLPQLPIAPFKELRSLQTLNITDCNLVQLDSNVFANQAGSLATLDLHTNKLTAIPTSAIANAYALRTLDIRENTITSLPAQAFSGSSLTSLDLSQNGLVTINTDAFKGLEGTLQYLTMKSCSLVDSKLPPLIGLVSLKELVVDNNNIFDIGTDLLDNMKALQYFSALENSISKITYQMFQGVGFSLIKLNLEGNKINDISNTFAALNSLKELYIGRQNVAPLFQMDTFASQRNTLQVLDVHSTGFDDSKWITVANLTQLKTLSLSQNSINAIPDYSFNLLKNLINLNIDNNKLTSVNQKSLFGTQNSMKYINFNSNLMTTLGHCTFFNFNINIYNILLRNNPLVCDCNIKWLREKYENEKDVTLDPFLDWTCAGPPNNQGKLFRDVPISDFVCTPSVSFPPCQDLTPTTPGPTSPTPSPSLPTTEAPQPLLINITDITSTSMLVTWTVGGVENLQGFRVEYFEFGSGSIPKDQQVGKTARETRLTGLQYKTTYVVCVEMILSANANTKRETKACDNAETKEQGKPIVGEEPPLGIIIGAVIGGLVLVAVIVVVAVVLVRRRNKEPASPGGADRRSVPFSFSSNGLPRAGHDSTVFSKPKAGANGAKAENMENAKMDHADGFTPHEREKILRYFRESGASTLSTISSGYGPRYVPEPMAQPGYPYPNPQMGRRRPASLPPGAQGAGPALPPRPPEAEGYLNPVMLRDNVDDTGYAPMNPHVYSEIPADGAYEEIPANTFMPDTSV